MKYTGCFAAGVLLGLGFGAALFGMMILLLLEVADGKWDEGSWRRWAAEMLRCREVRS